MTYAWLVLQIYIQLHVLLTALNLAHMFKLEYNYFIIILIMVINQFLIIAAFYMCYSTYIYLLGR